MSITAAHAIYTLSVAGLFPTAQQLQGFAADDVFDTDPLVTKEILMGVDGIMSAGFVFVAVRQGISLQADSLSNDLFDTWHAQEVAFRDVFFASGTIQLPGLGRKWTLNNGALTDYPPIPNAGRVLRPRKFYITWQSIQPALS
jgi:hypothetical protein